MKLFLVQHAEAKARSEDPDQPLNEVGLKNAEAMAAWMATTSERVDQIWHSGKRRAQQTAEIFGRRLNPASGVIMHPGLNPEDEVGPLAEEVSKLRAPLMIVGHLPFLSILAGYLITGGRQAHVVRFHNAGVVCLLEEQGDWMIVWVVVPDLIG